MADLSQKKTSGLAITSLILGCFFLIPLLGLITSLLAIIFGVVALVAISGNKELYKGHGLAISGIILGAVGVLIIPIIALLAAIAIPNLLRARLAANESYAQAIIRTVSTAAESYKAEKGQYPLSEDDLVSKQPQYLNRSYNNQTVNGYNYSITFAPGNYTISAAPVKCSVTGVRIFTMQNGELSESRCKSNPGSDY